MISVIIPTRNRASLLAVALRSIDTQTLLKNEFEVIIVDNGSTDNTKDVVSSFVKAGTNVKYLQLNEPGLHAGRHYGLREARGDILVYTDDDIEALPGWLAAVKDTFRDPDVALAGGNCIPKFEVTPPDWFRELWNNPIMGGRLLDDLSIIELPIRMQEFNPYYIWGCNFAVRKEIVIRAGGFHPDGFPDNLIRYRGNGESHIAGFVKLHGLKCIFNPAISIYHVVTRERLTSHYFYRKAYRNGIETAYIYHRELDRKGIIRVSLVITWLILIKLKKVLTIVGGKSSFKLKTILVRKQLSLLAGLISQSVLVIFSKKLRNWTLRSDYFTNANPEKPL